MVKNLKFTTPFYMQTGVSPGPKNGKATHGLMMRQGQDQRDVMLKALRLTQTASDR